jgi:hypothetical protein
VTAQPHTSSQGQTYAQRALEIRAEALRDLLGGQPRRLARMSDPGETKQRWNKEKRLYETVPRDKYQDEKPPARWLDDHISGRTSWAVTLDQDGYAQLGAADIDEGGRDSLITGLIRLHRAGLPAIGIHQTSEGGHSGGHIWIGYEQPAPIANIRAQLVGVLSDLTDEFWPGNRQPIRLPFGLHRQVQSFGELIWLDDAGEIRSLNLDDADQRADGWRVLLTMPRAGMPPEPPQKPTVIAEPIKPTYNTTRPAGRLDATEAIARFNAAHTVESVLTRYGAEQTRDGFSCPCGIPHTHETTLTIADGGKVGYSHSNRCKLANKRGFDAFDAECILGYHGSKLALLKVWNPPPKRQQRTKATTAPLPIEQPDDLDPARLEARRADAARKREAAHAEAAKIRAATERRAAADDTLSEPGQLVLTVLIDVAGNRAACRPSIRTISQKVAGLRFGGKPYSDRTIRRAIAELVEAKYIRSEGKGGPNLRTAWRSFITPADFSTCDTVSYESIEENVYSPTVGERVSARRRPRPQLVLKPRPHVRAREQITADPPAVMPVPFDPRYTLSPKERWANGAEYKALKLAQFVYEPDAGDLVDQGGLFDHPMEAETPHGATYEAQQPMKASHLDSDPRIAAERDKMQGWSVAELEGAKIKCQNIIDKPKPGKQTWKDTYRRKIRAINELLNMHREAAILAAVGDQEQEAIEQFDTFEPDPDQGLEYLQLEQDIYQTFENGGNISTIVEAEQPHSLGGAHTLRAEGPPPVGRDYPEGYAIDMIARLQAAKRQREAPAPSISLVVSPQGLAMAAAV